MKRAALRGAGLVALVFALAFARVVWSSRIEWREAEAKLRAGDRPGAVDGFGRAARLYAPGNPYARRGLDRLTAIARAAEQAGDLDAAVAAWRELRSSVLATRGIYAPNRARGLDADEHIATLTARLEPPSVDQGQDQAARRRWHALRLAATEEPAVGWTLVALLGLALWIGGALRFCFRVLDESDRLRRRPALAAALIFALGVALFVVGLGRA